MAAPTVWTDALLAIRDGNYSARWNYPLAQGFAYLSDAGLGQGVSLSYSFPSSLPTDYAGKAESNGFRGLANAEQAAAQWALAQIAAVCNVTFVQASGSAGQLRFGASTFSNAVDAAYAYFPEYSYSTGLAGKVVSTSEQGRGSDVWLGRHIYDALGSGALAPGQYFQMVLLHELGHAMGLKHPFEGVTQLPSGMNDQYYTVMSYNGVGTASLPNPSSLMPLDIAALQRLYGANTQTGAGDDVYRFSPTSKVLKTVWDAGGVNTLDFSAFTGAVMLDASEGGVSRASGSGGDTAVALAYGVSIHKAKTGSGDDTITAGAALRDIDGGSGNDTVLMQAGAYRFDQQSEATPLKLQGVELVKSGKTYVTAIAPQDVSSGLVRARAESICELYLAAFGRAPDADGFDYWLQQNYSGKADLQQIAAGFVYSAEYQARFPSGTSHTTLVTAVYNNVLARNPDEGGLSYWTQALASGSVTPQGLLLNMLGGAQGSDRVLLDNRDDAALYYTGKLAETGTAYDQAGISALLKSVSADAQTVASACSLIDGALSAGITLSGQLLAQGFSLV